MSRFVSRKRAVAVGLVASLVVAGAAVAYFSTTGTGTGQAAVGTSHSFGVTFGTTSGTMYPGTGTSNVPYTITNPTGSGVQNLSGTSVSVAKDASSGNILDHGTVVTGCQQSWFTATDNPPSYGEIADGASKSGSVNVAMADVNSSQDGCKSHTPDIVVNAS